ncbi:MAG: LPS assembly protein LptD [Proteobacteria bacterium]|nr:LPS assembly protein LptD [Pseudomonadota bacterium]
MLLPDTFSRPLSLAWLAALAVVAVLFLPPTARAADGKTSPMAALAGALGPAPETEGMPWRIQALTMDYEADTDIYIAEGKVLVWRGDRRFHADRAVFDRRENVLRAFGNVRLEAGEDLVLADAMTINLETETGSLENGKLVIAHNDFVITGRTIEKTGPVTYTATQASITTCPGPDPDWKITGKSLRVKLGGYGSVRQVVLRAGGVPVIWVPWFAFPVKLQRTTGLLSPSLGQSERQGVSWTQPLYWAPAENFDATLYDRFMAKRGNMLGVEGRWVGSATSRATGVGLHLDDREGDDGSPATSQWGYSHDDYDRPNRDRYWLVGKADWESEGGTKIKADLDWVSDQDFLREFQGGPVGFDQVNEKLAETFGRSLDGYDETVRENRLHANRSWAIHSASADLVWNDDVIARRWLGDDSTLQTLPFAGVSGIRHPVFGQPLAMSWDSAYQHFYSEDGIRGHRADLSTRFHLPFRLAPALHLDPSVGLRETLWLVDAWSGTPAVDRRSFSREAWDLRMDLSTELARTFETDFSWARSLRHAVAPMVSWTFRPGTGDTDVPRFDESDQLESENALTFSLINSLRGVRPGGGPGDPALFSAGWLELSQTYDLEEAAEDDPARFDGPEERRPFAPFLTRAEFRPSASLALQAESAWSWYDNRFDRYAGSVRWTGSLGHSLFAEYRNLHGESETVYSEGRFLVSDSWRLSGRYEYDLLAGARVESGLYLAYLPGCWSVEAGFEEEPGDRRYTLRIELTGLGSLGI